MALRRSPTLALGVGAGEGWFSTPERKPSCSPPHGGAHSPQEKGEPAETLTNRRGHRCEGVWLLAGSGCSRNCQLKGQFSGTLVSQQAGREQGRASRQRKLQPPPAGSGVAVAPPSQGPEPHPQPPRARGRAVERERQTLWAEGASLLHPPHPSLEEAPARALGAAKGYRGCKMATDSWAESRLPQAPRPGASHPAPGSGPQCGLEPLRLMQTRGEGAWWQTGPGPAL